MERAAGTWGRRTLEYGMTFLIAIAINFALPRLAPGDPLLYLIGPEATELGPEERREVLAVYGLDRPLPVQFWEYLVGILRGDLGTSVMYGQPVSDVLLARLPWTLLLVGSALLIAVVCGTLLGALSAWHEGDRTDVGLVTAVVFAMSAPGFWVGMLFIAIFAAWLGWFPSYGMRSLDAGTTALGAIRDVLWHLTLPVAALSLTHLGGIYLIARNSVLSTLGEDFLLLSRAKGCSDREVLLRHAVPNSLLPVYTRFTLQVGAAIGGAVVIETVFTYPGVGRLIFDAAVARDYPTLQGAFLLLTVTVIGANLVADLTYARLDPRTTAEREGSAP
ncbi:ABC transporter permease [Natronococcus wangiae]|uniref:ABC transporter permease n=1 Tax=Natronococcus wangiae TaxID=3068275 RepID=UPI00273F417E|nr:ABC transporter permease [Natronococcus sp. AD5]